MVTHKMVVCAGSNAEGSVPRVGWRMALHKVIVSVGVQLAMAGWQLKMQQTVPLAS
jgi:hypothetical protein